MLIVSLLDIHVELEKKKYLYSVIQYLHNDCTCGHKSNWKLDNLPFEYRQLLTTAVKKVGKSVAKKEEIRDKIGCSLKQIFAAISVVYGSVNVSCDMVCRWKKKFDSGLESIENALILEGQSASCDEIVSKVKEIIERDAMYTVHNI